MFFHINVSTSIQTQFFDEYILRDQACSFWDEIHYLKIILLRETNPDSQLTQLFENSLLLEARQSVHLEIYSHIFSRDNILIKIFPIGCYVTILQLNA